MIAFTLEYIIIFLNGSITHRVFDSNLFHTLINKKLNINEQLVLVCDMSDRLTFQRLDRWLKEFSSYNTKAKKILACSKADISKTITAEDLASFKKEHGCDFFIVSSLDGYQVSEMFNHLFETCLESQTDNINCIENSESSSSAADLRKGISIRLEDKIDG